MSILVVVDTRPARSFKPEGSQRTFWSQNIWVYEADKMFPSETQISIADERSAYAPGEYVLELETVSVFQSKLRPRFRLIPSKESSVRPLKANA